MFCEYMGGIVGEWNGDKIAQDTQKHTVKHNNAHTVHAEGALHEEMRGFHLRSQNQNSVGVWVWRIVFLSAKGANVKKCANVRKMSPHLHTVSTPFPLVSSCHSPSA